MVLSCGHHEPPPFRSTPGMPPPVDGSQCRHRRRRGGLNRQESRPPEPRAGATGRRTGCRPFARDAPGMTSRTELLVMVTPTEWMRPSTADCQPPRSRATPSSYACLNPLTARMRSADQHVPMPRPAASRCPPPTRRSSTARPPAVLVPATADAAARRTRKKITTKGRINRPGVPKKTGAPTPITPAAAKKPQASPPTPARGSSHADGTQPTPP
jgi:hypothetical protein